MRNGLLLLFASLLMLIGACSQEKGSGSSTAPVQAAASHQKKPVVPSQATDPAPGSAAKIDPERAMKYVRDLVAIGPRPLGSAAHDKMLHYILTQLQGANVQQDSFDVASPGGKKKATNVIAKFPGGKDGVIVIAGHYDTKPIPGFVGANDGGSSAGLLLELASVLRRQHLGGYSVWLVWLDAEESFGPNINEADGLYGSKHLADLWKQDGTASKIRAFILADMIGDADLDILRDDDSDPRLIAIVAQAAANLGYQSHFFQHETGIVDDHIAFARAGVSVIDLIDFDYGYNNSLWHTKDDTLDKLSPKSLQISGDVILETVRLLNLR